MEITQLRYFVAVAELLSFTKAAERCHVSQPSLSQQIQKLEQELGLQLVDRLGRRVKLTDAGETFYERAAAIIDAVDDAKSCVQRADDWQRGAISVGAIHTIAPYLLPEVVTPTDTALPTSTGDRGGTAHRRADRQLPGGRIGRRNRRAADSPRRG